MENNAILEKIRKLQALADRAGTEAEAALAAERVAQLCRAHNLEIGAVRIAEEETEASETERHHEGKMQAHWVYLANACIELFGVGYYRSRCAFPRKDTAGRVISVREGNKIVFYGLRASVASALVTYEYLLASVESMLEGWIRTGGRPDGAAGLRSFRLGCSERILSEARKVSNASRAQLAAAPAEVQHETAALVRVEKSLLAAHAKKMHLRSGGGFSGASNGSAYNAGFAAGGRVDLHGARGSRMLA